MLGPYDPLYKYVLNFFLKKREKLKKHRKEKKENEEGKREASRGKLWRILKSSEYIKEVKFFQNASRTHIISS